MWRAIPTPSASARARTWPSTSPPIPRSSGSMAPRPSWRNCTAPPAKRCCPLAPGPPVSPPSPGSSSAATTETTHFWCKIPALFLALSPMPKKFTEIPLARPATPLLDGIGAPAELRKLDDAQLLQLADELRAYLLYAVGRSGGHFGAGLGVIELTIALHYVFNTPTDRDRKSTRLNSSHVKISYAVFCLKK